MNPEYLAFSSTAVTLFRPISSALPRASPRARDVWEARARPRSRPIRRSCVLGWAAGGDSSCMTPHRGRRGAGGDPNL